MCVGVCVCECLCARSASCHAYLVAVLSELCYLKDKEITQLTVLTEIEERHECLKKIKKEKRMAEGRRYTYVRSISP